MAFSNKLLKLVSIYMLSEILVMAASFISFPIFTRILSKHEYGVMSLITVTVGFIESFSSMGIRHATQRYYTDYKNQGTLGDFFSTTFKGSLFCGIAGTCIAIVIASCLLFAGRIDQNIYWAMLLASMLISIRVLSKLSGCFFRVREESKYYVILSVTEKYLGMSIAVLLVTTYSFGIIGFYAGLLLGELIAICFYLIVLIKGMGYPTATFSRSMFYDMRRYGFPIIIVGFAGIVLTMGDRYLIGYFMGAEDVATYSVPYNLCSYISSILLTAFEFAFVPVIMIELSKGDMHVVQQQIEKTIKLYCMIALPIIFGVTALGEHFIILLASQKYANSSFILPYVITGEMVKGLLTPMMIGLQYSHNTTILARMTWYAVAVNIATNLILIPTIGLLGAALATLLAYVFLLVSINRLSVKHIQFRVPWKDIMRYAFSSLVMFSILKFIMMQAPQHLAVEVFIGISIFFLLQFIVDSDFRRIVIARIVTFRSAH